MKNKELLIKDIGYIQLEKDINEKFNMDDLDIDLPNEDKKRYNLKLNKIDLFIIDLIAKKISVTRTHLIEELLNKALTEYLLDIKGNDNCDIALIIAKKADELAKNYTVSSVNTPWSIRLIQDEIGSILYNIDKRNDPVVDSYSASCVTDEEYNATVKPSKLRAKKNIINLLEEKFK